MGGLEGTADGVDQVALDGVQVDGLAQLRGEGGHDCFGVVAGAVERPERADPVVAQLPGYERRDHEDYGAAVEPLELVAALAGRPSVGGYLHDQPGQEASREQDDEHHAQCPLGNLPRPGRLGDEIAAGIDRHGMPGNRHNETGRDRQREQRPGGDQDHGQAPPPAGRQPAIREQP